MTTSKPRAASNYRQVRLTFTEQARGVCLVSVMVKPVNVDWTQRHTVIRETIDLERPLRSMADVYALLQDYLSRPTLPDSHT